MNKQHITDDTRSRVEEHDKELALLHRDIAGMQTSMTHLSSSFDGLSDKLDKIVAALASNGKTSITEISSYLQVIVLGFALVSSIVAGIVYISGNANSSDLNLMRYKMDRLYGSFGWEPSIRKDQK